MQRLSIRQLRRDVTSNGSVYTTAKPWHLANNSKIDSGVGFSTIASTAYVDGGLAPIALAMYPLLAHTEVIVYVDANRTTRIRKTARVSSHTSY